MQNFNTNNNNLTEPAFCTVKDTAVIDNDGDRIFSKYYDKNLFTTAKEPETEKSLFVENRCSDTKIKCLDTITLAIDELLCKRVMPNTDTERDAQRAQIFCEKTIPEEMWEQILKNMDVCDLTRLRRVSKRWLNMIDRVIRRECKWYEKCLKDVPKKYWTSILEHQTNPELSCNDYHKSKIHSRIWISMYKSWIGWNTLISKETSQYTIQLSHEDGRYITSLSASRNIIAIGVQEHSGTFGHVTVYDITDLDKGPIYIGDQQNPLWGSAVRDVRVWRKDDDVVVVSCNNTGVQHWNVVPLLERPRIEIDQANENALISANRGYFYTLKSVPSNVGAENGMNELCTLSIERLPRGMGSRSIQWRKPRHLYNYAIEADGHKVIMLSIDDVNKDVIINEASADSNKLTELSKIHAAPRNSLVFKIFKPCVVACLSGVSLTGNCLEIGFSVAGRELKFFNIERDLHLISAVSSFFYHVSLLILGLRSGEICIIYVKDVDLLETLNLETLRFKMMKLDSCAIFRVAVTEYNSVQYIVAATYDKLHLVKFQ